jgi:hypothetical protein
LWELTGDQAFATYARSAANAVVAVQQADGSWEYPPMRSRRGLIATVEGDIATIALAESFRLGNESTWLDAARRWHAFLVRSVGFRESHGGTAVNYWAGRAGGVVPNNTTLTLWALAALGAATGDQSVCAPCPAMIAFLKSAQLESGELPYVFDPGDESKSRIHFLCYQYNAFECLDLVHYYLLTGDPAVLSIIEPLAGFLATGLTRSGAVRYNCDSESPVVPYYAAATAAALSQTSRLGLGKHDALAERVYQWVREQQAPDGGMKFFSRRNYGFLRDSRSYPRNLAMILYHLALEMTPGSKPGMSWGGPPGT